MLTLVINLEHRSDRRQAMHERLLKVGLTPTFIKAINGSTPENAEAVQDAAQRTRLSRNEVGCYLSHMKAWQHLLDSPEPEALILEDDVILAPTLPRVLASLQKISAHLHVVRLSAICKLVGKQVHRLDSQHDLICTTKNPSGTMGYYVTKAGAAMLLQSIGQIQCAVDTELDRYWLWGGKVLSLSPSIICADGNSASDIEPQGRGVPRESQSPLQRITRSIQKHWRTASLASSHPLQNSPILSWTPHFVRRILIPYGQRDPATTASQPQSKNAVLFLAHSWSPHISDRFLDMLHSVDGQYDLKILLDADQPNILIGWQASLGETLYQKHVLPFTTKSIAKSLGYRFYKRDRIVPGSAHYPVIEFGRQFTYDNYWVIEYDVVLNGSWLSFLETFDAHDDDLLCTHISTRASCPEWVWWRKVKFPRKFSSLIKRNLDQLPSAFFPLYRISKTALQLLDKAHQDGLRAHCEIAIPAVIWANDMQMRDFNEITPVYLEGALDDAAGPHTAASFRWRPVVTASEIQANQTMTLYHPVK